MRKYIAMMSLVLGLSAGHLSAMTPEQACEYLDEPGQVYLHQMAAGFLTVADQSGDGKISSAEFLTLEPSTLFDPPISQAELSECFKALDYDGDGKLDQNETFNFVVALVTQFSGR